MAIVNDVFAPFACNLRIGGAGAGYIPGRDQDEVFVLIHGAPFTSVIFNGATYANPTPSALRPGAVLTYPPSKAAIIGGGRGVVYRYTKVSQARPRGNTLSGVAT